MAPITDKQRLSHQRYLDAKPKQFGNLHNRMKCVMELLRKQKDVISNDLWQAAHDLETEVSYHEPACPPCGRRTLIPSPKPQGAKR